MTDDWRNLISQIHAAGVQTVIVVTGGGATAIAELLTVPGGSRTVLEAVVPYSAPALSAWLRRTPEKFCAEETALAMAAVARDRGCQLADVELAGTASDAILDKSEVVGVSCTASLASNRPKKGDHRCFVAVQGIDFTASLSLTLEKGARSRAEEEVLVSQLILTALARAADIDDIPPLPLRPGEVVATEQTAAHWLLLDLLAGRRRLVWSLPGGELAPVDTADSDDSRTLPLDARADSPSWPRGVLCGAFNPLHAGHRQLRAVAEQLLAGPVYYELSLRNVDKPPLDFLTIERRRAQFDETPLALTVAPTFAEKADALPGVAFVVGVDTAERIIQPRYYADGEAGVDRALQHIRERGCRFLVAGRAVAGRYATLADLSLPAGSGDLFAAVPTEAFRVDISSTELRSTD